MLLFIKNIAQYISDSKKIVLYLIDYNIISQIKGNSVITTLESF